MTVDTQPSDGLLASLAEKTDSELARRHRILHRRAESGVSKALADDVQAAHDLVVAELGERGYAHPEPTAKAADDLDYLDDVAEGRERDRHGHVAGGVVGGGGGGSRIDVGYPDDEPKIPTGVEIDAHAHGESKSAVARALSSLARALGMTPEFAHVEPAHGNVAFVAKSSNMEEQYTLAPVYIPDAASGLDAHGEWASASDLQKAMWDLIRKGDLHLRDGHDMDKVAGEIVESVTWPQPVTLDMSVPTEKGTQVRPVQFPANTPFLGVVWKNDAWERVKKGEITGYSIGGRAVRVAEIPPAA